jgi:hypothetical protein
MRGMHRTGIHKITTKESILQGAIDDINKLEKSVKSAKTLRDILVLHHIEDMPLTLMSIGLQLKIFKMILQDEGILPRDLSIKEIMEKF